MDKIGGFMPAQRYFIGYAQSWCSVTRPESIRLRTATDPHSPPNSGSTASVADIPEFRQAFSCKARCPDGAGQGMPHFGDFSG